MNFGIFTMVPTTNAGTSSPKFLQIFNCKKKSKIFPMWRIAFMLALNTFPNKKDGQKLMNFPGLRTFQALVLLPIWTETKLELFGHNFLWTWERSFFRTDIEQTGGLYFDYVRLDFCQGAKNIRLPWIFECWLLIEVWIQTQGR
jgi:hypothetical protein